MTLVGSDFIATVACRPCCCSECGRHIAPGARCLESSRFGRVQKRVCSEACRLDFDDKFWQGKADQRAARA